jgi:hypothetical protein
MPGQNASELPKRRMPRHGRAAPRVGTTVPFVVDRQTIDALPTPIHKAVAEKLISEGSWVVKDTEKNEVVR